METDDHYLSQPEIVMRPPEVFISLGGVGGGRGRGGTGGRRAGWKGRGSWRQGPVPDPTWRATVLLRLGSPALCLAATIRLLRRAATNTIVTHKVN